MNEKNIVINNYSNSLGTLVSNLGAMLYQLGTEKETNDGIIKSADILLTAINSQIVVLRNELDNYNG